MLNFFRRKKLEDIILDTKTIRIKGVKFVLRKINVLDYLEGNRVLQEVFKSSRDLSSGNPASALNDKKVKEQFAQVLCAGIVSPKLSLTDDPEKGLHVEKLFVDWDMVNRLYEQIILFTYGKKKFKRSDSLARD